MIDTARIWRGLPWLAFATAIVGYFGFTADDAYIVGRYAHNTIAHGVLAYDVATPLSALTSPLHALLAAGLGGLLMVDPVLAWKLFSVLATLAGVAALARHVTAPSARALFLVLTLLSPPLIIWTVGGLETALLLGLLALLSDRFLRLRRDRIGDALALGALAGLALLTRLDSVVFLLPIGIAAMHAYRGMPRAQAALITIPAGLVILWLAFSYAHFGHLMPTSLFQKTPAPGTRHVITLLRGLFWCGVLPLAVLCHFRCRDATDTDATGTRRLRTLRIALLMMALYLATMASTHMMFAFRAAMPYLPILLMTMLARTHVVPRFSTAAAVLFMAPQIPASYYLGFNFPLSERIEQALLPAKRLEPFWQEYAYVSAPAYAHFIETLESQSRAIAEDWQKRDGTRAPIVFAFAEGATGYSQPEIRFQGFLVSSGHCAVPDYVMDLRSPKLGISLLRSMQRGNYVGTPFTAQTIGLQLIPEDPDTQLTVSRYVDLNANDRAAMDARVERCLNATLW